MRQVWRNCFGTSIIFAPSFVASPASVCLAGMLPAPLLTQRFQAASRQLGSFVRPCSDSSWCELQAVLRQCEGLSSASSLRGRFVQLGGLCRNTPRLWTMTCVHGLYCGMAEI